MLEAAVAAGIAAAGGEALLGGVLPTPGAPLLIGRYGFDLGVVLSASHNPYRDNGIKFFGGDGFKLSDATELEIEALLDAPQPGPRLGRVRRFHGALEDYLRALHERFADLDLSGRRMLLDCANGATYEAAPEIFRRLGADVDVHRRRAGRPQHQRRLRLHAPRAAARPRWPRGDHDAGFAFDGDGDRVLAVDRNGTVVDGDELIALARHAPAACSGVAVTVMTNYGFHTAMRERGHRGRDHAASATATCSRRCASAAGRSAASSPATSSTWASCPPATGSPRRCSRSRRSATATCTTATRWRSCRRSSSTCACATAARSRAPTDVHAAVEREAAALEGRGRVLLRPSGTEPLVRVMVEAPTADEAEDVCARLVALVEAELT